jgi:hypothetical protein
MTTRAAALRAASEWTSEAWRHGLFGQRALPDPFGDHRAILTRRDARPMSSCSSWV